MKFEGGKGYWATNVNDSGDQIVVIASERSRGIVTFVKPSAVVNSRIGEFDGRETAIIRLPEGDYFISSATVAPIAETAKVMSTMGDVRAK